MSDYPDLSKTRYTIVFAFRIEEQLKKDIEELKSLKTKDVNEAFRIAMRKIVSDLKKTKEDKAIAS